MDGDETAHIDDLVSPDDTGAHIHCLVVTTGEEPGRIIQVGKLGQVFGRSEKADVRITGDGISGTHCRVSLVGNVVIVQDLGSTNGVHVDGERVAGAAGVPIGSVLQIGRTLLRHEVRDEQSVQRHGQATEELERAAGYVKALLPAQLQTGPVRVEWRFLPSAQLGGDAFGYHWVSPGQLAIYLIDVCGHGAASALHSVSVINVLRGQSLPGVDFLQPAQVLGALNRMFQMDDHGEMFFTIWYGVYDVARRTLRYASGGHPPALLRSLGEAELGRLRTPAVAIGMMPDTEYSEAEVEIQRAARLYVFSDGAYEVPTAEGRFWSAGEFESALAALEPPLSGEPERIERVVRDVMSADEFDDDFSLLIVGFPEEERRMARPRAARPDIHELREFAVEACRAAGADDQTCFSFKLAVEEACTNILRHGYGEEQAGPISVAVRRDLAGIEVIVEDEAPAFRPEDARAPDLDTGWDERTVGGLGWHLVREYMDEISHTSPGETGNRVRLARRVVT